ncbi:ribosome-releasing factor 2, mitochondrial-like isoform X2 [Teleopsis dalmanni]|nr:ribosome-releasing factor 2, mitochondrial-like isoform X2 [Teleopsis dalmanni]
MLFYSGKIHSPGEVHRGNTVTDCLTQERERGITICSSAVSFSWSGNRINLLDTPGHIDFTMEVEQSLHAVDGVIIVLDAAAGVEAQTLTVWAQANKHSLPRIVFVNKMDRTDSDFEKCIADLRIKLGVKPLSLQIHKNDDNKTLTIYDVITLQKYRWNSETLGRDYVTENLVAGDDMFLKLQHRRNELIDELSGLDDELADFVIKHESFENITNKMIYDALRRTTLNNKTVPVILGSAYKNIGIQKLMDAVIQYLPAPHERNQIYDCFGNDFVGKVFKIIHDKHRGPLTLVRVYRGNMKKGQKVTLSRGGQEILNKIFEPLADEYREIDTVQAGNIGICSGLKNTTTGDLLIESTSSLKNAQKRLKNIYKNEEFEKKDEIEENIINEIFSTEPQVPVAVYFCSIEPPNLSTQSAMELALKQLQREDPSLTVRHDEVTGQTVLGGMGELHMEIIKSRILTEYKIDVDLGPLQIAYKETIDASAKETYFVEKDIAGIKQNVTITLELIKGCHDLFSIDKSPENVANVNMLRPRMLQIIRKGALSALERGPRVGGQVVDTQIKLHNIVVGRGTADSFIMAAAVQCIQKILNTIGTRLLEPVMEIQIVSPAENISQILADLSRRRGIINEIVPKSNNKVITAKVPLAELFGYSTSLRTISSGTAMMTMQPCGFSSMNTNDEIVAIRRTQGFE